MRTLSLSVWAFWGASAFAVDIDNDGLSDIWQQKFGAQALLATADDDGDGIPMERKRRQQRIPSIHRIIPNKEG